MNLNNKQIEAVKISIVMPCMNEGLTVGNCVDQALKFLDTNQLNGEVIVADNGSTDDSVAIAKAHGAKVIDVPDRGYGNALRASFAVAQGEYIIMGDSDGNHDLFNLMPFVEKLDEGYELVVGNRFLGGIEPGSMPWIRQYIGNPFLSFIGRLFFKTPVRDFHCGLRGFKASILPRMNLQTTGMELASEMIIKSSLLNMRVAEVPIRQYKDAPGRESHLNPINDGWRHLRFLLLYSPRWLFLYPGLFMLIIGAILSIRLFFGPIVVGNGIIDFHTLMYAGTFTIIGLNLLSFSSIIHVYAFNHMLLPTQHAVFKLSKYFKLETGVLIGGILILIGLIVMGITVYFGLIGQFKELGRSETVRLVYISSLLLIAGAQIVFTSFVLSILGMKVSASHESTHHDTPLS